MVGCWLCPPTLKTSFSTAGHLEMRRQSWPRLLHNVFRSSSSSVTNWQSTTSSNLPNTVSITNREISLWLRSLDVLIITWIVDISIASNSDKMWSLRRWLMWLGRCPSVWSLTVIKTVISNYFWFSKLVSRVWTGPWLSELKCLYDGNCGSLFSISLSQYHTELEHSMAAPNDWKA